MARPLRIEFDGALHHVTSRGNERRAAFRDGTERALFLNTLAQVCRILGTLLTSWTNLDER